MDVVLPAYTHLQRAQPVLAPHYWLAYVEKLARDRQRLADCRKRVNISGLGAAACAGTSLPIDRHWTAKELGFEGVAANSLDVSSDRDFALESAFVLALIATHLSGWAEEWILWSTVEFSFIKLPQQFCTGSSIMPQKINPDTLELTRGKAAELSVICRLYLCWSRVCHWLTTATCKRTNQRYSMRLTRSSRSGSGGADGGRRGIERPSIAARLERGHLDATTLMEILIKKGFPQRTAHHLVGSLVAAANQHEVTLSQLTTEQLQAVHPELDSSLTSALGVVQAVKAYRATGRVSRIW